MEGVTKETAKRGAYTDDAKAYVDVDTDHESVSHSVGKYVREMAHTNGMEWFRAMLERGGCQGVYHHIGAKHLDRHLGEYAGCRVIREADTMEQMEAVVTRMIGKRIMYQELVGDAGAGP